LFIDDGPQLDRPRVGVEVRTLVAELGRETQSDRQVIALRASHARPEMSAGPPISPIGLNAGVLISAALVPLVQTVRDFESLVFGGVRAQHSIESLRAFRGEVAVHLHHRGSLGDQFRPVYLDFKIALGMQGHGATKENGSSYSSAQADQDTF